jgi:alkanesulfonate monooxygenase SsuD/methylene tetrahydromethanopterin reductase-like flavin-dependent oxidoreductase (luciferase family)
VFLSESALGDPIVLAAGLAPGVPRVLLGARVELGPQERHPAMLARDITCLDLVCGGRSVLCFAPPFTEPLAEAIHLCRALWLSGEAVQGGPHFPVQAAPNRARPAGEGSPLIALDLSAGHELPDFLVGAADLLLRPIAATPAACRLESV